MTETEVDPLFDEKPQTAEPIGRRIPMRYLAPNVITVLAICAGLTGIRLAFENRFELAVSMVLLAAFLDGIDGRIARMMKGSTKFGAQMDSLADIVNFGVAPALVLYAYMLDQARSFGWIAALLYCIACCLRLARFNVMLDVVGKPLWQNNFFTGVPAPAGAMLVMLPVYLGFLGLAPTRTLAFAASAYTVGVAVLMINRLPVYSGKAAGTEAALRLGHANLPVHCGLRGIPDELHVANADTDDYRLLHHAAIQCTGVEAVRGGGSRRLGKCGKCWFRNHRLTPEP